MIQASQISAPVSGPSNIGAVEDAAHRLDAVPRRPSVVPTERQPLHQSGEAAALSAAIQRLIAERDRHKGLAATQESELIRLRAINDELRRQNEELSAARDRYLGLATGLLAQLQQVDTAIHDALQKSRDASESGDAAISAFARRFSPKRTAGDGTPDY
jgi:hypothetical protein